ncbi:hypothetical protein D0Z07_1416 [Hyphodiscus hymeniophilus]|uniref:TM7S3/TM198-like domain-containing protein n=1 Tax=Hyphodiscus hymeniophilus TaxID=353542 RepID=A0A9P6VRJ9_9HELO|nr:hypothetical protein D0Z07_1416 [Hyphodiscus hymeniophilus]
MSLRLTRFLALFALYFCISLAVADPRAVYVHRRDGPTTPSTITESLKTQSSSPTQSGDSSSGKSEASSTQQPSADSKPSSAKASSTSSTPNSSSAEPTSSVIITAITSNINGAAPTSAINTSSFNETATPGKLPLTPEVTPAYCVAGIILMLSGAVYTIVGIKNRHLHICLSAGYLASLAVTVLILYVMNPPVSNAIQGAYLVAVVATGVVLGGAAIVFSELTEGLGCLLGGFALSMWLLVLKPGGLLTSTSAKSGFIAAFTVAGFATSFSHITRPYALIGFISFGGATVVVLGIDCVSRAGLKEFWAYIWDLNNNLFPVGATTYPLTRGMKVEIAAIVVIFLAGMMSQMKLWKVIKKRREQRALERLENERTIQKEEEHVGRRIEQHNAQERNQWEAVYGDKELAKSNANPPNRDSGLGDMDSQKKGPTSTVTSVRHSADDEIEMADIPSPMVTTGAGLVMSSENQDDGPISVRVARDPEYPTVTDENGNPTEQLDRRHSHMSSPNSPLEVSEKGDAWLVGSDKEARLERRPSERDPSRNSMQKSAGPDVVPLPFKVPEDSGMADDNSSLATFADDEPAGLKQTSKRLSASSAFLRTISKRSNRSSKRYSTGAGNSTEDLVNHQARDERPISRESSLAATMDGLSDDDDDMRSTRSSIVHLRDDDDLGRPPIATLQQELIAHSNLTTGVMDDSTKRLSTIPVDTGRLHPSERREKSAEKAIRELSALTSGTDQNVDRENVAEEGQSEEIQELANSAPSVVSTAESKPAILTKESLPPKQSKVVMSYRTNEWAKHLSTADAPDLEELKLAEYPVETEAKKTEVAAPVNVEELQQTAEYVSPAPSRSASQMSNNPVLIRSTSSMSKTYNSPYSLRPQAATGDSLSRSTSQLSLHGPPQPQNSTRVPLRSPSTPLMSQPIVESPIEDEASHSPNPRNPYGSQPTLIGHRDTMIRSKSSLHIASPLSSTPEFPQLQSTSQPQSQIHSSATSQAGSDGLPEDDNMSLSHRRDLIRQQSLVQQPPVPFDTHQPRRQSTAPHPLARESQLASFRASVQNEFVSAVKPRATIERQRSQLWMEKQAEEQRRNLAGKKKEARDRGFDERMRRGNMLSAHRDALRKMQAKASGTA